MFGKNHCTHLCPFSFGLALGITAALAVLVWTAWVMFYGVPPMMAEHHPMIEATWGRGALHAVIMLVKGFVGGFVFAFIYDWILCIGGKCCTKTDGKCECGSKKQ